MSPIFLCNLQRLYEVARLSSPSLPVVMQPFGPPPPPSPATTHARRKKGWRRGGGGRGGGVGKGGEDDIQGKAEGQSKHEVGERQGDEREEK